MWKVLLSLFAFCVDVRLASWISQEVSLPEGLERFVFEAVRGGDSSDDVDADIAIDNVKVELGKCYEG